MHNDSAKNTKKHKKYSYIKLFFCIKIGDDMNKSNVIVKLDYKLSLNNIKLPDNVSRLVISLKITLSTTRPSS